VILETAETYLTSLSRSDPNRKTAGVLLPLTMRKQKSYLNSLSQSDPNRKTAGVLSFVVLAVALTFDRLMMER
jgi:hypothetical protein